MITLEGGRFAGAVGPGEHKPAGLEVDRQRRRRRQLITPVHRQSGDPDRGAPGVDGRRPCQPRARPVAVEERKCLVGRRFSVLRGVELDADAAGDRTRRASSSAVSPLARVISPKTSRRPTLTATSATPRVAIN